MNILSSLENKCLYLILEKEGVGNISKLQEIFIEIDWTLEISLFVRVNFNNTKYNKYKKNMIFRFY